MAIGVALVSAGVGWGYIVAINGGLEFLLLMMFVAACLFHKAFARWLFGHADPTTKASKLDLNLRGEILLQWSETRRLFHEKGWDATVGDVVEAFTLLKVRRDAPTRTTVAEPPPLPTQTTGTEKPADFEEEGKEADVEDEKEDGEKVKEEAESTPVEDVADAVAEEENENERIDGEKEEAGATPVEDVVDAVIEDEKKEEEPSASGCPGVDDLVGRIFNEDISGYESTETFRREFEGLSVMWRGRLLQVEEFTYDTVFGGEAGVKAVIEIAEISTGYGRLPVEAVVRLPVEKLQQARADVGSEVAFGGELFESDPYSRRVFLKGDLG